VHRLDAHYRMISERLGSLRHLFSDDERLKYFEESLAANELEVALHALCTFLLEPSIPPVSSAALERIGNLHSLMQLEDDCVERLRLKASRL
jgi:hypothetical protein